ncbi:MAG: ComEC/Rec2 family competence protein, partial [Lachnospiraceae bacterium]
MVRRPLCVLCLTGVMLMFVWLLIKGPPEVDLSGWTGRKLLIHGTVSGKESRGETQVIYLSNVTFSDMDAPDQEYSFSATNYKNYSYGLIANLSETLPAMGASITLAGKISEFSTATNPGEFDLRQYYLLQGYCGKVESAELVQVSEKYNIWEEEMYQLRCYLSSVFAMTLEEQDASVMCAMLLGEKSRMDKDVKELYQASGIAHILAISG